jgi:hypothetical protein
MLAASDIKKMSVTERLRTMELLWKSISAAPEKVKSPKWHGTVLAGRLAKVESGAGTFHTLPQLKARLRRHRP